MEPGKHEETAIAVTSTAFDLPDEGRFRRQIEAINRFQQLVHATMIIDQDYGIIPGTQKPTLLKPGAEKISKLLGLSDTYMLVDRLEDWIKPFFRYIVKCTLLHGEVVVSEGMGECNSMESKYRWRWVGDRDLPKGTDKTKLVSQERHSRTGGKWTVYRLENEDIYSQVNTILKMAKKRALVDAALSAGRLSNVFTQDMEDTAAAVEEPVKEAPPIGQPTEGVPTPPGPTAMNESAGKTGVAEPAESRRAATPARDPSSVKTFGDLYPACHQDFGLKTRRDVWHEYGVTSQEEISETPAEVYLKIAAVRANKGGAVK